MQSSARRLWETARVCQRAFTWNLLFKCCFDPASDLSSVEPNSLNSSPMQETLQVTGNAMSVPVVGAALTALLRSMAAVTNLGTALPLSITQDSREALARRKNLKRCIRHEIALLEGTRLIYQRATKQLKAWSPAVSDIWPCSQRIRPALIDGVQMIYKFHHDPLAVCNTPADHANSHYFNLQVWGCWQ